MRKTIRHCIAGTALLNILFTFPSCVGAEEGAKKEATVVDPFNDTTAVTESQDIPEEPASVWQYREDVDRMTSKKEYYASTNSTNEIEFDFPYNGGSTFQLVIRNTGEGNNVLLAVSKGQFMTSVMSSERVRVKFDDQEPNYYTYESADNGNSEVIFLNNEKKFISKLKKAKKLMIEAPFFDAGNQIIEFDVEGLKWSR